MPTETARSTPLSHVPVGTWMHPGILSCPDDATFAEVARVMGERRVHALAVVDIESGRQWGVWHIIRDIDLTHAIAAGRKPNARALASTEAVTIAADESIQHAARLMTERGVSHLVVVHEQRGYPVGILSTLDVACACAAATRDS